MKNRGKNEKVKILIIDDEEKILSFFRNLCQLIIHLPGEINIDIECATETSPIKALEIMKNEQFQIIVVDYALRNMNGIELLTEIRKFYKLNTYIPIFLTAAGTISQFREEQKDLLFHYFLEKPVDQALAIAILKKAILGVRIRKDKKGR